MYELRKGSMRLVVYSQEEVALYKKGGWKLVEKEVAEETPVAETTETKEAKQTNVKNTKRKSVKR